MRGALHFNLLPRHPLPFQTTCSGAAGSRLLSIFGLRGGIKELFFLLSVKKGVWTKSKNPYKKKLRWSKKGEGVVS